MARVFSKGVLLLLAAVCVAVGLWFLVFSPPPAKSPSPLPNPNGYDDLVRAGKMLTSDFAQDDQAGVLELRRDLETNAAALNLVRTGLAHECRVPVEREITNRLEDFGRFKTLSRGLLAQARLAQAEQHPAESLEALLTNIRLGQELSRGGLIIDGLVGLAVEAKGLEALEKVAPQLEANACKQTAAALMQMDARRPEAREVINQEAAWASRLYGFRGQIVRLMTRKQTRATEQKFSVKYTAQQARLRQAAVDLAAQAFEAERQSRPRNLNDLVPGYLPVSPAGAVVR